MQPATHTYRSTTGVGPLPPVEDVLERSMRGFRLDLADGMALLGSSEESSFAAILAEASRLRDEGRGRTLTYSPKVFLPLTNLCRDHCSYCTFRKDPSNPDAWTMTHDELRDVMRRGRRLGCREALLCLGDRPETSSRRYRVLLNLLGYESTVDYVVSACEVALAEGLWPHTNAGVLTAAELARLRPVNVSMGLMLENVSPRLRARGGPHHAAPDKDPTVRLRTLEDAGRLRIPFTSGILIGIGETLEERVASLLVLRDLHEAWRHVQEVIVQNFRAKADIRMADAPEPADHEMAHTVAVARILLGPEMNLQAPPNLSPRNHRLLIRAGINDWGGISPLTPDFVNPEAPWPHVRQLARTCAEEGYELRPRLPVYPEYVRTEGFVADELRRGLLAELDIAAASPEPLWEA